MCMNLFPWSYHSIRLFGQIYNYYTLQKAHTKNAWLYSYFDGQFQLKRAYLAIYTYNILFDLTVVFPLGHVESLSILGLGNTSCCLIFLGNLFMFLNVLSPDYINFQQPHVDTVTLVRASQPFSSFFIEVSTLILGEFIQSHVLTIQHDTVFSRYQAHLTYKRIFVIKCMPFS